MPHSFGIRARTRHMFKKGFKGALCSSMRYGQGRAWIGVWGDGGGESRWKRRDRRMSGLGRGNAARRDEAGWPANLAGKVDSGRTVLEQGAAMRRWDSQSQEERAHGNVEFKLT